MGISQWVGGFMSRMAAAVGWILETGTWNDSGTWDDTENWID